MEAKSIIDKFCEGTKFFMVKFENEKNSGKILKGDELLKINLKNHEIHRSLDYKNGDLLFVYNLKPKTTENTVDSQLQLLLNNLVEARTIEMVYPNIFRWAYDGVSIKAYAIVPSGNPKAHSTITRYGGTEMFVQILSQHIKNVSKMHKGITPDFSFIEQREEKQEKELSVGSINLFNKSYSVFINTEMKYSTIVKNSMKNKQEWKSLNTLDMKYWAREINPDFITEAKHVKLKNPMPIDMTFKYYPEAIKRLMKLSHKGNYYRFLLVRFLLSAHTFKDAKFIYYSVLSPKELDHVKNGDCHTQWNFILNSIERYSCPTFKELKAFKDEKDKHLVHPLEKIQRYLEKKEIEDGQNEDQPVRREQKFNRENQIIATK